MAATGPSGAARRYGTIIQIFAVIRAEETCQDARRGRGRRQMVTMKIDRPAGAAPTLLYLVTEDWYFLSHRLPMARAAQHAGYDVHVVTNVGGHGRAIADLGFRVHPVQWRRGSMNPFGLLAMIRTIRAPLSPAGARPRASRGAAADRRSGRSPPPACRSRCLNAVTGWGFALTSAKAHARLVRGRWNGCCRACAIARAPPCWCRMPTTARRWRDLGVPDERIFPHRRLRRRRRSFCVRCRSRMGRSRRLRRAPARQQRAAHARRRARAARAPRPRRPAADCGRPRPGQSGLVFRPRRSRPGASAAASCCSATSPIFARYGRPRTSRCCRRGARGCPRACSRPRPAAGRSWRPTSPAVAPSPAPIVNALLAPPDDAAALADAIDRLGAGRGPAPALRRGGRRLAEDEFSSRRIGRETVALYDRLLGRAEAHDL